jgi:hypothetical protein
MRARPAVREHLLTSVALVGSHLCPIARRGARRGEWPGSGGPEGAGRPPLDRGGTGTVDRRSTSSCVAARHAYALGCALAVASGCTPSDPAATPELLVRSQDEPAGERCPAGGTAITTGLDRDLDGMLDDAEIERVDYVCGARALVRQDVLSPGGPCPEGGLAVRTGRDRNGNGALDDDEIEATTTLCDPGDVWYGDLMTSRPADRAALARVRVVTGSLSLSGAHDAAPAPHLTLVGGSLVLDAAAVELPALERTGGSVIVTRGSLALPRLTAIGGGLALAQVAEAAALPALVTIAGDLTADSSRLTSLTAPALTSVAGRLRVAGCDALAALELPALVDVRAIAVSGNQRLGRVALPAVAAAGPIAIMDLPVAATLDLSGLAQATDALELRRLPALATLELPMLDRARAINVSDLGIQRMALDRLTLAGTIAITAMPALAAIELPALVDAEAIAIGVSLAPVEQPQLTALRAPRLDRVKQLRIEQSPRLAEVVLGSPREVELVSLHRVALRDLSALFAVTAIGLLAITECPSLGSLAPIHPLQLHKLQLRANPALTTLAGLEAIASIPNGLTLSSLPTLTSLAALRQLDHVGGHLEIRANAALPDLAGLDGLSSVTGPLIVVDNPQLTTIAGLRGLVSVTGEVVVDNPRVPAAEVEELHRRLGR